MENGNILRNQLKAFLFKGNAHLPMDAVFKVIGPDNFQKTVPGLPYGQWQLLEHIRIAQWDIIEFVLTPGHVSPEFPAGYWPDRQEEVSWAECKQTMLSIKDDLQRAGKIIDDETIDLSAEIPHAPGYTYLRELLLIGDHNTYHLGGLVILQRLLGLR